MASTQNHTVAEMRQWIENNRLVEKYATTQESWKQLRDVYKTSNKVVSTFSKETLRGYLQNIGSYEVQLRNLSRYLYYRSQVYYRLIKYFANMLCLDCRSVIPKIDLTKDVDANKMLKSYNSTLDFVDNLNLIMEFTDVMTVCLVEDVYYGLVFTDDTGTIFYRIDPDYAKIDGRYMTGDFSFSMDMSYFNRRPEVVEYIGEPLASMYRAYDGVATQRWQQVPEEYCVCIKANHETWDLLTPPFVGLFNSLISLCDLEDIQAIADEQQIYKLIWMELETITGSKDVNDFKVDPAFAQNYFKRLVEDVLPDYSDAIMIPGKLNTISFDSDQATDTNKVQKATETVLNTSGGAQILNSATISGTTAFTAAMKADAQFVISMFLYQIQAWTNRFTSCYVNNNCKIKLHPVSIFTKDDYRENLLKSGQYGLPTKLAIGTFNGFSEKDTLALSCLENDILKLQDKFKYPLFSSHTLSSPTSNKGGAPTKDEGELTDDGEASRDKTDNKN